MQVQTRRELQELRSGQTAVFDLIKSNAMFRNPMYIVQALEDSTYGVRIFFNDIPYIDLNVNHTNEAAYDMFVLSPMNRWLPPNIFPAIPNLQSTQDDVNVNFVTSMTCRVINTSAASRVFCVIGTWEIN